MSGMSNYLEDTIADHIFGDGTWAKPTDLTAHLFTAAPTDAGGGTEVSGGSYAAVSHAPGTTRWNLPTGGNGVADNATEIAFPAPTADWGQVVAWAIKDQASNFLIIHTMATPKTVNNGDPAPKFNPNTLQVTFA